VNPWSNSTSHLLCNKKTAEDECFAATYGANTCDTHSVTHREDGCVGLSRTNERDRSYCEASWCYIDPNNCFKPHSASTYFNQPSNNTQYYSYETCGNLDSYTSSAIEKAFANYEGDGRHLRVQVPGDDTLGVRTRPDAKYQNLPFGVIRSFSDFGKYGHAIEFMEDVLNANKLYNFEITEKSPSSTRFSPGSSFTACIHDIALNNTDVCVGNFWMTEQRQMISGFRFTASTYQDNFFLVTRRTEEAGNVLLSLDWLAGLPVQPFTLGLWMLVLTALTFMGFCKWLIEGWENDEAFPSKDRSSSIRRSIFFSFQSFFGNGDFKETPATGPGQIAYISLSLLVLVLLTAYLAQMTTILSRAEVHATEFLSLNNVVSKGGTVCCMNSLKDALKARHPSLTSLKRRFVGFENTGLALEAMDGGYILIEGGDEFSAAASVRSDDWSGESDGFCSVVIATDDEWDEMSRGTYR